MRAVCSPEPPRLARQGFWRREPMDSDSPLAVVWLVGGLLRDRLDDAATALNFWQEAVKVLRPAVWKAECEIEAADLATTILLMQSRPMRCRLGGEATGKDEEPALTGRLNRVWGDGMCARATCPRPGRLRSSHGRVGTRKSCRRARRLCGAHSRSTEEFLRDKALDRAWAELRRWQEEYPIDKVESYLTLLQVRLLGSAGTSGRKQSRWPGTSLRNFAACQACRSGSRLLGLRGSRLPGTSVTAGLAVGRLGHGLQHLLDHLVHVDPSASALKLVNSRCRSTGSGQRGRRRR